MNALFRRISKLLIVFILIFSVCQFLVSVFHWTTTSSPPPIVLKDNFPSSYEEVIFLKSRKKYHPRQNKEITVKTANHQSPEEPASSAIFLAQSTRGSSNDKSVKETIQSLTREASQPKLPNEPISRSNNNALPLLAAKFPKVIIIGFGKSGTRTLYDFLLRHPSLTGPRTELRYFSNHFEKGLTWYLSMFPSPSGGAVTMEKSPDYIIKPLVPGRLINTASRLNVDVHSLKFVVMLRDPINRAMSEYLEWAALRNHKHDTPLPPFSDMVYDDSKHIKLKQVPFLNASAYAYHLENWLKRFSSSQMCYVDGDAFVKDPLPVMQSLEKCLNISSYFRRGHFVYVPERGFYCFKTDFGGRFCENKSKGRPHPPLSKELELDLRKVYKSYDGWLSKIINQNFTWMR